MRIFREFEPLAARGLESPARIPGVRHRPDEDLLSRFLSGETTRAETREVVRHLLAGCPDCRAFTSAAWRGLAVRSIHGRTERMTALDLARRQIRRVRETLQDARYQLIGVQASIPPSRQEASTEDLKDDPDAPTGLRSILANAVRDSLDPLIQDLNTAAEYEPGAAEGEG
jgi:hypothetical protein